MADKKPIIPICNVCGRPLPPKPKSQRGKARSRHHECSIAMAHIATLKKVVPQIRFMPPVRKASGPGVVGHAKKLRSELSTLTSLVTSRSKTSTTDQDYYQGKK